MATRSRIGMEQPNGEVRSIYCHWDGYPEGVGATLQEHYVDPEKVEALIALGDISVLQPLVEPDVPGVEHSFANPAPCVTVAYHRDRGESFFPPRVDASVESFSQSDIEEYGYVFTQSGEWKTFS
tara:strand:- start:632 stop:1006 length:375 start_codon:yes stop_codon:yes gene_type:complete